MAITLNGTTGITTPDITSEAGLTVDGVSFASGAPANTLVTTSSGNVGIGTSSPQGKTESKAAAVAPASAAYGQKAFVANIPYSTSNITSSLLAAYDTNIHGADIGYAYNGTGYNLMFATNSTTSGSPTERARIDSSGDLLVGTTSTSGVQLATAGGLVTNGVEKFWLSRSAGGGSTMNVGRTSGAGTGTLVEWTYNGATRGTVTTNGTNVAYNTSSDYRLKENVVGVTGAAARVQQLNPVRFNFIADPNTTVDGFLAHEVQDVVPEAITGTKDATEMVDVHDEDGNVTGQEERPVYQGIDQSKLVPLLTAALQEALGKIETLEARVAALEAA